MAINIPIITEFSDAGLKSAKGAFDNFRAQVGQAEGAMGKLKAGSGAAFDAIKANAGAMALGAGTAIAGFAIKAIGDFQNLALEVDKFSDVTGLAAEEASKWVEVAGDMGIESGTVEASINRMNREIGKGTEKFEELGIEIVRTSGGAVDVNETFLNTIEALKDIQDPAKRATVAAELLGKGWTGMAEMVEAGAGNLRSALDEVSDAKIIDEEEIRKAKELRAAQDRLKDALEDVTLQIGEALIPALSDAADALAPVLEMIGPLAKGFFDGADANASYAEQASKNNVQMRLGVELVDKIAGWLGISNEKTEEAAEVTEDMARAWRDGYRAMVPVTDEADDQTQAVSALTEEWDALLGRVNAREAWRNLQDRLTEADTKIAEVFGQNTPEAMRQAEEAIDDQIQAIAKYVDFMEAEIPDFIETKIVAALNQGDIAEARRLLEMTFGEPIYVDIIPNPLIPGNVKPFLLMEDEEDSPARRRSDRQMSGRESWQNMTIGEIRTDIRTRGFPGATPSINLYIQGSVLSERDLVETIRRGLVDSQRSGNQLIYQNV